MIKVFAKEAEVVGEPRVLSDPDTAGPSIDVCIFPPTRSHPFYSLCTIGMSDRPVSFAGGTPQFVELMIFLPKDWPVSDADLAGPLRGWPVAWLRRIAKQPELVQSQILSLFASDGDRPLGPNTQQNRLYLRYDPPLGLNTGRIELMDCRLVHRHGVFAIHRE